MQSIDTPYKGFLFRSRLEARWAHFWDAMGVEWSYEPEPVDLGTVRYLPDFWTPLFRAWVEIKGEVRDDRAGLRIVEQCGQLARQSTRPVVLCFHDPLDPRCVLFRADRMYAHSFWGMCPRCGELSITIRSTDETQSAVWCPREHGGDTLSLQSARFHRGRLYNAALAARQARFGFPGRKTA